jgi:hypothetical protein
MQEIR